ncbi:MAG: hypothetical protein K2J11_06665 [Oscillospiraceae bacterium]|nr:hypothetical protein [Oscillospiraceae bacterium]
MNMKKTIAAIAAGAVAVSAMATTVSAVESGTLNYNLVNTLQNQKNGKLTLKATFPNVKLVAGQEVVIEAVGMEWTDKVVVSGQYIDTNKAINPITFTRDIWSEGYSAATEAMMSWDGIHIPVKAVNDGSPALIGGDAEATNGTEGTAAVATATYNGFAVATNIETIKANNIPAGNYTLVYQAQTPAQPAKAAGWYTDAAKTSAVPAGPTLDTLNALKDADPTLTQASVDGDTTVYYYDAGTAAVPAKDAGFFTSDGAYSAASFGIAKIDGATAGDKITVVYTAGTAGTEGTDVVMANITVTVNMKGITDKDWETVNKKIQAGTYGIKFNGVFGDATGSAYTAPTPFKAPLMTQVSNNKDIVAYLENANVNGSDKAYKNVRAVLNDAIENFETVTFTFNTAAANVRFAAATGASNAPVINTDNINKEYNDTLKKLKDGEFIVGLYAENDWEGVDTYKAFGDHTYDWFYSPEGTGFTGMDWGGQNLFAGALIVNEGLTMSLSNTEYFDWTKTSVSFDWDAIMDGAATTNNYATYIHTLKLATSNMWFWDSMDVVLVAGDADTVDADAAAEVDENTIDDDEDDIDADDDDEDVDTDDDDDDEDVAPVVDEPAPAPVVSNPPTGNASVALAVIPVALAAAAIVAKKRG